jgi:hypothetical protein
VALVTGFQFNKTSLQVKAQISKKGGVLENEFYKIANQHRLETTHTAMSIYKGAMKAVLSALEKPKVAAEFNTDFAANDKGKLKEVLFKNRKKIEANINQRVRLTPESGDKYQLTKPPQSFQLSVKQQWPVLRYDYYLQKKAPGTPFFKNTGQSAQFMASVLKSAIASGAFKYREFQKNYRFVWNPSNANGHMNFNIRFPSLPSPFSFLRDAFLNPSNKAISAPTKGLGRTNGEQIIYAENFRPYLREIAAKSGEALQRLIKNSRKQ